MNTRRIAALRGMAVHGEVQTPSERTRFDSRLDRDDGSRCLVESKSVTWTREPGSGRFQTLASTVRSDVSRCYVAVRMAIGPGLPLIACCLPMHGPRAREYV